MKSMVVFFALAAVACASWAPLAQPYHYPAIVLDPHGRPLDTPEVINARALHLQAKALEGHYGLAPAYGWAGALGYGHRLYKRSLAHVAHALPAAVSHQSRVDVIAAPVVAHAVAAPVVAHAVPAAVSYQNRVDNIGYAGHYNYGYATPYNYGYATPYNYGYATPYNYGYAGPYSHSAHGTALSVHPW